MPRKLFASAYDLAIARWVHAPERPQKTQDAAELAEIYELQQQHRAIQQAAWSRTMHAAKRAKRESRQTTV